MHLGESIKKELFKKGYSAKWLSVQLQCERTNVYNIFKRENMDVDLLAKISVILKHNFFADISEELFGKK